jgi:hypothetical protein
LIFFAFSAAFSLRSRRLKALRRRGRKALNRRERKEKAAKSAEKKLKLSKIGLIKAITDEPGD